MIYLALTDPTTTIVLSTGTSSPGNYAIVRRQWGPATAGYRRAHVGQTYHDVIEELDINVYGATPADIYQRIQALIAFLARAQRSMHEPALSPSLVHYVPQGSGIATLTKPLVSRVLGPPPGESGVTLPPNWSDIALTGAAVEVRLRFMRRGRWLYPHTHDPLSAQFRQAITTPFPNGNVALVTYPASNRPTLTPIELYFNVLHGSGLNVPAGYFCYSTFYPLFKFEGEHGAVVSPFSVVTDTAAFASNNQVLRATLATTTPQVSVGERSITVDLPQVPYAVLAVVRPNRADRQFWLRFGLITQSNSIGRTDMVAVPRTTSPVVVPLGILPALFSPSGSPLITVELTVQVNDGSGSPTPTLDIDYCVIVPAANRGSRIIRHDVVPATTIADPQIAVINREWEFPTPLFGIGSSAGVTTAGVYYDAIDIEGWITDPSPHVRAIWIAPSGPNWRYAVGGNVVNMQFIVYRSFAYISPE